MRGKLNALDSSISPNMLVAFFIPLLLRIVRLGALALHHEIINLSLYQTILDEIFSMPLIYYDLLFTDIGCVTRPVPLSWLDPLQTHSHVTFIKRILFIIAY